jgi:hypothetical protein
MHRYRKYLALILFLVLIAGIWYLPFKVNFKFRSTGWIQPQKKWSLRADLEGNFYGDLINYETGAVELSTSYRFERGDIATLSVREGLANNVIVNAGDTIGYLYSRLVEERLKQLQNLLAVEQKLLQSSSAGEKPEILQNLKQKLTFAEQQFDFARKNYDRSLILYQDSVITATEFELAETDYLSAITNIDIAKSEYEAGLTGSKPEEIRMIEEQIRAYASEIDFLQETKSKYLILSPVTGKIVFNQFIPEQTEYISITDTSNYILNIPVKVQYKPYLISNGSVEFSVPGVSQSFHAKVFDIADNAVLLISTQVFFVKAIVTESSPLVAQGLSVQCTFYGEEITISEYINRSLDIFFR